VARLRRLAKTGSAVDALVVAYAEPDGTILAPRAILRGSPHTLLASVFSHPEEPPPRDPRLRARRQLSEACILQPYRVEQRERLRG